MKLLIILLMFSFLGCVSTQGYSRNPCSINGVSKGLAVASSVFGGLGGVRNPNRAMNELIKQKRHCELIRALRNRN